MSPKTWDAAVIGGGPAGTSAAITLAERGLNVILLEAKTYPHEKMCGEFLSPEAGHTLRRLGLDSRLADLGAVPITTATLSAPDGAIWETPLPGTALGVSRRSLDARLAERARGAGINLREESAVTDISGRLSTGFRLEVTSRGASSILFARSVIAAHGKRSVFDRALGRRFLERRQPFVAIKAHFTGPRIPGRIELHAFPGGYCGISEIEGDTRVVCLLVHERVLETVRRQHPTNGEDVIDRFITWMAGQDNSLYDWLQRAERIHQRWITIAQVPFVSKPTVEGDILMAGDAAGLIVPLAGNGITMALESGELAAGYLSRHLEGQISEAELLRGYTAAWKRRYSSRLRLGRALQPLLMRPEAASLALRAFHYLPGIGQYFVRHTRGKAEVDHRQPGCHEQLERRDEFWKKTR